VGLDEFLDFCALVEAEPLVCVNAATEGPADAVGLMEHCAARRTEPRVRFWQVGNELSGDEYEKALRDFCRAMKQADPDAALLTSYAPSRPTLKEIAGLVEYVAPHFYELSIEKAVAETAKLRERLDTLPETRHVKIAVTEWNETGGRWGVGRACLSTLGNGLYVGRMLNHFRRNADLITIANRSNLVDSWLSGSIQVCGSRMWFHPAYHVQRLFSNYGGRRLLRVADPPADLDMTAALDDAGNVCLTVINTASESQPLDVELARIAEVSSAKAYVVAGEDEWACNHVAEPDKIGVEEQSVPISGGVLEWRVPAHAAAVVVAGKKA
jgi:alpha-N-arabinofuranosidase